MNTFYYKATDRQGKAIEGNLQASDYRNAVAQVRSLNYFPINISILSDCLDKISKTKFVNGPETNCPLVKLFSEKV
mgnify:CR=1 FL=1